MQDEPVNASKNGDERNGVPRRVASSRKTLGLQPGDPFRRAGSLYLASQLDELRRHDEGVRRGDVDAVHDQRAATRRLQAGLALFQQSYDRNERDGLTRPLRRLGQRLGTVRDRDVMLAETRSAGGDLERAELNGFLARLEEQRASGRVVLLEYLDGDAHRRWISRLSRLVDADDELNERGGEAAVAFEQVLGPGGRVRPVRVRDLLPALLWRCYGRVSAYEPVVADASPEMLHSLRKAGRRLRYAVETFRELLGDEVGLVLRPLREMQDALGAMHDAQELVALLLEFEDGAGPSDCVQPLIVEERGRALEARAEFDRVWPSIVTREFRARLSGLVACL
jgi:CHAD domain-containing protein